MASPVSLLRDIAAFVTATKEPSSADKPARLAVVDATYTAGWPKVTFEGEATVSGKQYPHVDSYSPAAGDRVVMIPVGTTYLIVGAVSSVGAGLPAGAIQPYAGASAPSGWLACNGAAVSRTTYARLFAAIGTTWGAGNGSTTFNVPDLRGRAPVGAGTGSGLTERTLASSGGAETVTLSTGEIPAHDHGAASSHTHSFSDTATTGSNGSHSHGVSGTTGADGSHSHGVGNQGSVYGLAGGGGYSAAGIGYGATGSAGSHAHSFSGTTDSAGSHTHSVTVSGTSGSGGGHTHTSVGSGGAHGNMQPWRAVTYIVKV